MTYHFNDTLTSIPVKTLIAHMGHDLNNLFSVIIGGLALMKADIPAQEWNQELQITYEDILCATQEAATRMKQLNTWAGRQPMSPTDSNLNEILSDTAAALHHLKAGPVQLQLDLYPQAVHAVVDPQALNQTLQLLLANGLESMPNGGKLMIRTLPGPCIEIQDEGEGMSSETLRLCTRPFYSTRKTAGHHGLGLAIASGFARASKGYLSIDSEPSTGTRIRLFLPKYGQ